jgi:hypothetical protein
MGFRVNLNHNVGVAVRPFFTPRDRTKERSMNYTAMAEVIFVRPERGYHLFASHMLFLVFGVRQAPFGHPKKCCLLLPITSANANSLQSLCPARRIAKVLNFETESLTSARRSIIAGISHAKLKANFEADWVAHLRAQLASTWGAEIERISDRYL